MNDDQQVTGLIRRAGGPVGHAPDFDEIYRRARRRRTTRTATTAVVTVVALLVAAGVGINAITAQQTIQFAQAGREPAARVSCDTATSGATEATVEGSFRATIKRGNGPTDVIDVVDGRVHARAGTTWLYARPSDWQEWGGDRNVFVDEQIVCGDETYLRAGTTEQGPARWYRYTGSRADLQPELAGRSTPPVFTEGTHGFRRVEDAKAAAQGLTRYSADAAAADLGFLTWFAPINGTALPIDTTYERGDAAIDIWVDANGLVHRIKEVWSEAGIQIVTRFDRFDALGPIALPFDEGDEVPVATDTVGAFFAVCGDLDGAGPEAERMLYAPEDLVGDPALAETVLERLSAELDRDEDVAAYNRSVSPAGIFLEVRFGDHVREGAALEEKIQRLLAVDAVASNERSSDSQGHARVCSGSGLSSWIDLDG